MGRSLCVRVQVDLRSWGLALMFRVTGMAVCMVGPILITVDLI